MRRPVPAGTAGRGVSGTGLDTRPAGARFAHRRDASAAASTRSRSRGGGITSSTARGRAPTTRRKVTATSRQVGHPSACERTASASSASRAPSTHAATALSSSSWSDIDQASPAEVGPHLLERKAHPAFQGAERPPGHVRNLDMGVTAEVGELDDLALLGGKTGQCVTDRGALERKGDLTPGIGGRLRVRDVWLELALLALAAAAPAQIVNASILHGGQQPGAQRAALRVEACGAIPHVHERVLDRVLRSSRVAQHSHRHAKREGCVTVVKLSEGLMVAGREPRGQLLVTACGYDVRAS